jgi:hypothetical protein
MAGLPAFLGTTAIPERSFCRVPGEALRLDNVTLRRARTLRAYAGECAPKIRFGLVRELAAQGFPVAVTCRVLKVSASGFYEWRHRRPSVRDPGEAHLIHALREVPAGSRRIYGVRRCRAELCQASDAHQLADTCQARYNNALMSGQILHPNKGTIAGWL